MQEPPRYIIFLNLREKNLPVAAAETVSDLQDGQVVVIRVVNQHIALEPHGIARHVLEIHVRQVRRGLLHVRDLVRHHLLRLVHQPRHNCSLSLRQLTTQQQNKTNLNPNKFQNKNPPHNNSSKTINQSLHNFSPNTCENVATSRIDLYHLKSSPPCLLGITRNLPDITPHGDRPLRGNCWNLSERGCKLAEFGQDFWYFRRGIEYDLSCVVEARDWCFRTTFCDDPCTWDFGKLRSLCIGWGVGGEWGSRAGTRRMPRVGGEGVCVGGFQMA